MLKVKTSAKTKRVNQHQSAISVPGFECRPKEHLIANELLNTAVKIKISRQFRHYYYYAVVLMYGYAGFFVSLGTIFEIQIGMGIA